jgi:DNA-binding transcriptional MocR family regulator
MSDASRDRWVPAINRSGGPLYTEITSAIVAAIRSGRLLPGDRLPPHREMARALSVDLTTVTRAYAGAQKLGLLEATAGRGTFVRTDLTLPRETTSMPSVIDLTMNVPSPPDPRMLGGKTLPQMLQERLTRLLRHPDAASLLAHRWGAMSQDESAAGAAWMRPCHSVADSRSVLVFPGAQSAMNTLLSLTMEAGGAVLCERMAYPGLRALCHHLGLRLIGVETDDQGFVPQALEAACATERPRVVYCNPTIHNPTTTTMGIGRRRDIATILRGTDALLVEDDAYGLLPDTPIPSISSLLPERAYYLSTLSKTLSPSLRIAFLATPGPDEAQRVCAAMRATALMPSGILSALVASWIAGGEAAAILRAVRHENQLRQKMAAELLPAGLIEAHPNAQHAWLSIRSSWTAVEFVAVAKDKGLALVPAPYFQVAGPPQESVRIALGSAPDQATLRHALQAIASIHAAQGAQAYVQVV